MCVVPENVSQLCVSCQVRVEQLIVSMARLGREVGSHSQEEEGRREGGLSKGNH